jgi:hypothetical protein
VNISYNLLFFNLNCSIMLNFCGSWAILSGFSCGLTSRDWHLLHLKNANSFQIVKIRRSWPLGTEPSPATCI